MEQNYTIVSTYLRTGIVATVILRAVLAMAAHTPANIACSVPFNFESIQSKPNMALHQNNFEQDIRMYFK